MRQQIGNRNSEPEEAGWLARGKFRDLPHVSDLHYPKGMTLWACPIVFIHMYLFPSNKHFTCFNTFCGNFFMEIYLLQSWQARALSLATVPSNTVTGTWHPYWRSLTLIAGWELKSCFSPWCGWGHLISAPGLGQQAPDSGSPALSAILT